MRRLTTTLLAAAACVGVLATAASAADSAISLTPAGMQPNAVTIQWGETVTFTNADTVPHAVAMPRLQFTSEAIQPGGTFAYAFTGRAGRYNVRQVGGRAASATVTVELSGEVSLEEPARAVPFGQKLTLTGTSSVLGHPVAIQQLPAGAGEWTDVTTTDPGPDGAFAVQLTATPGARYRATAAAGQLRSRPIRVLIAPVLSLRASTRSTSAGALVSFTARVRPPDATRRAVLEAFDRGRKRWVTVASGRVSPNGAVTFRWRAVAGRIKLRAAVERQSLATGYSEAASRPVVVRAR